MKTMVFNGKRLNSFARENWIDQTDCSSEEDEDRSANSQRPRQAEDRIGNQGDLIIIGTRLPLQITLYVHALCVRSPIYYYSKLVENQLLLLKI